MSGRKAPQPPPIDKKKPSPPPAPPKQTLQRCLKCCAGDEAEHCIICGRLYMFKEKIRERMESFDELPDKVRNVPANMTYYGVLLVIVSALEEIEKIELEER